MSEYPTVGELIFGKNNSDKLQKLLCSEDVTREEAQEVLKAIQHKEIRDVLDKIQAEIQLGFPCAGYSLDGDPARKWYYILGKEDPRRKLLFTDWSYRGFMRSFHRLLERASPDYKAEKVQIGEILLIREGPPMQPSTKLDLYI